MKKRNGTQVILAALAAVLLAGCAAQPPAPQTQSITGDPTPQTQPAVTDPAPQAQPPVSPTPPQTQPAGNRITPEQAKTIALNHAGLTPAQVTGLRAEYDVDDGVAHYDVEFRQDRWEYEYEIHGQTGAVLSFEKDD